MDIIELCDFWDSDSEEEDNKDEKEKKIRTDHPSLPFHYSILDALAYLSEKSIPLADYQEINTPPPKFFYLFS